MGRISQGTFDADALGDGPQEICKSTSGCYETDEKEEWCLWSDVSNLFLKCIQWVH
jgi:hypothetical protein